MSEATRSAALLHATTVHAGEGHEAVLVAAKKFDAFLTAGTATEATDKPAPKAPAGKPATPDKPVGKKAPKADEGDEEATIKKAMKKAAAAAEEEDEDETEAEEGGGGEPTQEQVETSIADLLGANLRKQAVALLAEYSAKAASGVKPGDRAEFIQRASDLLLGS
jgi:hypothetical protein